MGPGVPQPKVKAQSLHCPNCGGPIELRGFAHSLTAVCAGCLSVLDASSPTLHILQKIQEKNRRKSKLPLGTRGKFGNTTYELTGFQTRGIEADGETYEWGEYVLFNPYKGFLYLTEYNGHWNVVRPIRALPEMIRAARPAAKMNGEVYRHFQHASARTVFVLGEFPWRVKVGETVVTDDYTNPPKLLSSEGTGSEITWSLGEYVTGQQIWQTFGLKDSPPVAYGTYVNQPNPRTGKSSATGKVFRWSVLALMLLAAYLFVTARRETVLNERHHFYPGQTGEQSFVTPEFELKGRTSNVEVKTTTDVENNWMYLNYALINSETGAAYDFGREISYYRDSDGTEGGKNDSIRVPAVPPGKYYLRVEPEGDAKNSPVEYDIIVRRDVPSILFFILGFFALTLPAIASAWSSWRFEYTRWQESDYPKVSTTSSSSSGDDD